MSSRRPKKLNIMGFNYDINIVPDLLSDDDPAHGRCLFDDFTIEIRKTKDDFMYWYTLIHEAIHVVGETLNLEIHTDEGRHSELDYVAYGIADMLYRNKLLKE